MDVVSKPDIVLSNLALASVKELFFVYRFYDPATREEVIRYRGKALYIPDSVNAEDEPLRAISDFIHSTNSELKKENKLWNS